MFNQKDIVICIRSEHHADKLSVNKQYEVLQYNSGMEEIKLIDDRGKETWWFADRFQLDDTPYREGDIVRCIKGTISSKSLHAGVLYTVIGYSKSCDEIRMKDSMGDLCWWAAYRFEKVTKDNMTKENLRYMEMQKFYLELVKLKKGDRVLVTAKAVSCQQGWYCIWHDELDKFVGQYAYINSVSEYGINLSLDKAKGDSYNFPYFVVDKAPKELPASIELPSGEYNVTFYEDGDISVGCQSIPYDTLKAIYETATSTLEP